MYFPLVLRHYTHLKPFVFSVFCPPICPPICPCKSQKTPFFNFFCPTINLADFTHSSSQPSSIHPQKLPPFRSHSRTIRSSVSPLSNLRLNRLYHCFPIITIPAIFKHFPIYSIHLKQNQTFSLLPN